MTINKNNLVFNPPVLIANPIIITQNYKPGGVHKGIDIRSFQDSPIFSCEKFKFLRSSNTHGVDLYGNHYIVIKGIESGYIIKYIHNIPYHSFNVNDEYEKGKELGHTVIGGNSKMAHLHFEVWSNETAYLNPITDYLVVYNIMYEFKKGA